MSIDKELSAKRFALFPVSSKKDPSTSSQIKQRESCVVKYTDMDQRFSWGDGLTLRLERWTGDPKVEGSNPDRNTRRKTLGFSESKKLCVYARILKTMYAR